MIDKEFVLVSQGIEIYRTKSQENAVNRVKEYNDEYFDYLQKCYDNYERPADNYVDLEIEYSNKKEKDKEIERLNNIINELEKWIDEYYKSNRKWYNAELSSHDKRYYEREYINTEAMLVKFDKQLKELKGSANNE